MIERPNPRKLRGLRRIRQEVSHVPEDIMHVVGLDHKSTPSELVKTLVARRAALPEGPLPEATPQQIFYSQVLFVLKLERLIKDTAAAHHDLEPHLPIPDELSPEVKHTRNAITTLYVLNASGLPLEKWRKKWKGKAEVYEGLLDGLTSKLDGLPSKIDKTRAATIDNAALITDEECEAIKTLAKPKKYSSNYRKTLVTETEPNVDKRKKEIWNVGISGAASIPTAVAGHAIAVGIAGAATAQSIVEFGSIYHDWKTAVAAVGAAGVSALSYYANYRAQLHLLEEVGISPSIVAKLADYGTKRLSPGDEKLRRKRIFLATAGPTIWTHPVLLVGLLFGGSLPFIGYELGTAAANLLEAGVSEGIVLGAGMIRKRKEQIQREQQPPERPTS